MVEGMKPEYVLVQRGQDKEKWVGKTVSQVFQDVRVEGSNHPQKGSPTGYLFARDVRGYDLPCHGSQLSPATKEDWDKELKAWEKEKAKPKESGFSGLEVYWNTTGGTNAQSDRSKR